MIDKKNFRAVASAHGVEWVGFDHDTGRHTFTKRRNKTIQITDTRGHIVQVGGIITDEWIGHSTPIWEETECFPDQIDNGDLAFMLQHGLSQGDLPT